MVIGVQHRATVAVWCAYSSLLRIVHSPTMISSQIQMSLSRQQEFLVVSHGRYFCYSQRSCFRGARIFKVSASVCIESQGSNFDRRPRMQKNRFGRLHEVGVGMLARLSPAIALDLHMPRKLFKTVLFIYGFSVNIN
jgi:hypothetical protein